MKIDLANRKSAGALFEAECPATFVIEINDVTRVRNLAIENNGIIFKVDVFARSELKIRNSRKENVRLLRNELRESCKKKKIR